MRKLYQRKLIKFNGIFQGIAVVCVLGMLNKTQAQTFIETSSLTGYNASIAGLNTSKIAMADVNGDNLLDLIVAGKGPLFPTFTYLYTNSGTNFNLVSGTPFNEGANGTVKFADVNNDGRPDVFISGERYISSTENVGNLYINNGGSFTLSTSTFPGVTSSAVEFADVNGDTFLDMIITGEYTNSGASRVAMLYTNSGGNFTEVIGTPFEAVYNGFIKFLDVNNDNKPDVLIGGRINTSGGSSRLYTNTGTSFVEVTGTPFATITGYDAAVYDANADGNLDILLSGYGSSSITKLYTNSGTNFSEVPSGFEQLFGKFAMADIDNNTHQDILYYGSDDFFNESILLYTNSGTNFAVAPSNFVNPNANALIEDVNNDGKKDVIVASSDANFNPIIKIYLNAQSVQIVTQPQSINTCSGVLSTFSVSATGTALSYLWSNGATTRTMNTAIAGIYRVTVSGVGSSLVSNAATLTGIASTQITLQPQSQTICGSNLVTLSVAGTGTSISYLWSNGANTPTIQTALAGTYRATVSGTCGLVVSNIASVSTVASTSIIQQPVSRTVCGSSLATLDVTATGSNLTYLWSNGATTRSIQTNIPNSYTVTVTGFCGSVSSNTVTVTTITNTQITLQPQSQILCGSNVITLSVAGIGSNITYLWSDGATTTTIQPTTTGTYMATVSGTCGSISSSAAQVTSGLPSITGISQGTVVLPGLSTADLDVTAIGSNLQYRWSNGATTRGITGVGAGEYFVTVTGACGSVVSEGVLVGNLILSTDNSGYTYVTSFGTAGAQTNQFYGPNGVTIGANGRIYIADHANDRVSVWSQNGTTFTPLTTFGTRGKANNQLDGPRDIHIGADGKIFITDGGNSRVSVWQQSGNTYLPFTTFGTRGNANNQFQYDMQGITTSADGKVYITDGNNNRVSVWTPSGNTYIPFAVFGSKGSGQNQFSAPVDIAIGTDGKIFVADHYNNRISVWNFNGANYTHLLNFGSNGTAPNELAFPYRINVLESKIYISEIANHRISVWTQSGNTFGNFATFGSYGSENGTFNLPSGVQIKDKYVFVADYVNYRISVWKTPAPIYYLQVTFDITAPTTFTGSTATLTWPTVNGVIFAVTYCLRISKDRTMGTGVKTVCGLTGNSYTYNPNNPNGRTEAGLEEYYWQVAGVDEEGNYSQWSEVQQFSLDATVTSANLPTYQPTKVSIYPNPSTNGEFRMENGESVTITDVVGKEILSTTKSTFTIASKGIFIARVKTKFGITTLKLVVE